MPHCCRREAFEQFANQVSDIESPEALVRASVAIASHQYSQSDASETVSTLKKMAAEVRKRVRGDQPQAQAERRPAHSSAVLEPVPGATHGEDQLGALRHPFELLAQMADVHVDAARVAIGAVAPDRAQELLAARPERVEGLKPVPDVARCNLPSGRSSLSKPAISKYSALPSRCRRSSSKEVPTASVNFFDCASR